MLAWLSGETALPPSSSKQNAGVPTASYTAEYRNTSQVTVEFYLLKTENFESVTKYSDTKEIRLFSNHGNAIATLKPSSFDSGQSKPKGGDLLCILGLPLSEFETKGPPMLTIACYDITVNKDVKRLQRGFEGQWFANSPEQTSTLELGTLSEFFASENGSTEAEDLKAPRPVVTIRTKFIGVPETLWKYKGILRNSEAFARSNPEDFTPAGLRKTWKAHFESLKHAYPGAMYIDRRMGDIYLDRVIFGGKNQNTAVPFGPGFMTRSKIQTFDVETLVGILGIGHGLATGFQNFSDSGAPAAVTEENIPPIIQASLTLLPSMIPYLDDSCRRLGSSVKFRVEEPSDPFETDCLDCEDGSRLLCSVALAIKAQTPFIGETLTKRGKATLLYINSEKGSSSASPSFGKDLFAKLAEALKGVSPCLALVDYVTPHGGLMGMEGHVPHATALLIPDLVSRDDGKLAPVWASSSAPQEYGAKMSVRSKLEGMMTDSVNPMISHSSHQISAIEGETAFLTKALEPIWSDCRFSFSVGPGSEYQTITKVLGLFTTDGQQLTVMGRNGSGVTFGTPLSDMRQMFCEPIPPQLTGDKFEYAAARGAAAYPCKAVVAKATPSVTLLRTIEGRIKAFSSPPVARVHLPSFDFSKLERVIEALSGGDRTVGLLEVKIPGVISVGLIVLSWV